MYQLTKQKSLSDDNYFSISYFLPFSNWYSTATKPNQWVRTLFKKALNFLTWQTNETQNGRKEQWANVNSEKNVQ